MSEIAAHLLAWYAQNARQLPWRSDISPYRTWVSEIMLQQTQVETVIPYFERFTRRFPDLASLAQASQAEVLQAWEGLGYYSRARNLHKCAQLLCAQYDCQLPADLDALQKLPGIGLTPPARLRPSLWHPRPGLGREYPPGAFPPAGAA